MFLIRWDLASKNTKSKCSKITVIIPKWHIIYFKYKAQHKHNEILPQGLEDVWSVNKDNFQLQYNKQTLQTEQTLETDALTNTIRNYCCHYAKTELLTKEELKKFFAKQLNWTIPNFIL